jgi:hypothetical protein
MRLSRTSRTNRGNESTAGGYVEHPPVFLLFMEIISIPLGRESRTIPFMHKTRRKEENIIS